MIVDYGSIPLQQGWQCPICKEVMAPRESYCIWCHKNGYSNDSSHTRVKLTIGTNGEVISVKPNSSVSPGIERINPTPANLEKFWKDE